MGQGTAQPKAVNPNLWIKKYELLLLRDLSSFQSLGKKVGCTCCWLSTRGVNLWFHHDTILNRFIGQRYDNCRYQKSAAIRFRFDSVACDRYETISYAHLTQPVSSTHKKILIIISTFYCFALPDVKQKPYIYKLNLIACNSFQNKCICNHFTITINNMIIKYVLQCPLGGFSSKKNKLNSRACNSFQNKCISFRTNVLVTISL